MYMEKVVVNSYRLLIQTVRNNNCQHYNPIGYTDELLWDCGVKTKLCWHKQWLWTPQCNDRLNNKKYATVYIPPLVHPDISVSIRLFDLHIWLSGERERERGVGSHIAWIKPQQSITKSTGLKITQCWGRGSTPHIIGLEIFQKFS